MSFFTNRAVDLEQKTKKEIGALGEKVAAEYLRRSGYEIVATNVRRNMGELDVVAKNEDVLHFVEVKSIVCKEFPDDHSARDAYDPVENLHPGKIRRVSRTAAWYVASKGWEGEWQIDGVLVWLRKRDGLAKVRYLPHIV